MYVQSTVVKLRYRNSCSGSRVTSELRTNYYCCGRIFLGLDLLVYVVTLSSLVGIVMVSQQSLSCLEAAIVWTRVCSVFISVCWPTTNILSADFAGKNYPPLTSARNRFFGDAHLVECMDGILAQSA